MAHSPTVRFLPGLAVLVLLAAAAPAVAATCRACEVFGESCTNGCLELETKAELFTCLSACDGAAAACTCDEPVTLSSEGAVFLGLADPPSDLGGACHGTSSCPSEYSSCASWSSYSPCGDPFCGTYKWCPDPPFCEDPEICFGPALRTYKEQFRVCFNAGGQQCTEYRTILDNFPLSCGC